MRRTHLSSVLLSTPLSHQPAGHQTPGFSKSEMSSVCAFAAANKHVIDLSASAFATKALSSLQLESYQNVDQAYNVGHYFPKTWPVLPLLRRRKSYLHNRLNSVGIFHDRLAPSNSSRICGAAKGHINAFRPSIMVGICGMGEHR